MRILALLLLSLAGCRSGRGEAEEPPVTRADASAALYRQFDAVLERRRALLEEPDREEERERLLDLAEAIVVEIARIDPQADLRSLVRRIDRER